MKRTKRLLMMAIGLIICLGILVGCGRAPKGFIDRDSADSYPFKFSGEGDWNRPTIQTQFPEFKSDIIQGKFRRYWFIYSDEKHFLIIPNRDFTTTKSIYREARTLETAEIHEKIGDFVDVRKKYKKQGVVFSYPFLYGDYLYYEFSIYDSKGFGLSDWDLYHNRYIRYEFYKFDLRTGENEDITLTEYVDALRKLDSRWEINPDYKGEK